MSYPEQFTGFQSPSAEAWKEFKKQSWAPRPFEDVDVDIEVECCGVCASDLHRISGEWVIPLSKEGLQKAFGKLERTRHATARA